MRGPGGVAGVFLQVPVRVVGRGIRVFLDLAAECGIQRGLLDEDVGEEDVDIVGGLGRGRVRVAVGDVESDLALHGARAHSSAGGGGKVVGRDIVRIGGDAVPARGVAGIVVVQSRIVIVFLFLVVIIGRGGGGGGGGRGVRL